MAPKKSRVASFLAANQNRSFMGGAKCRTCIHPKRKEFEAAALEFVKAQSAIPFRSFIQDCLAPEYGYPYNFRSMVNHMEKCLGQKVSGV